MVLEELGEDEGIGDSAARESWYGLVRRGYCGRAGLGREMDVGKGGLRGKVIG